MNYTSNIADLIEATMFSNWTWAWNLIIQQMSWNLWNTLIPSCPVLPNDIDDSDHDDDEEEDNDNDDDDDDLSSVPFEIEEADYMCSF